MTSTTAPCPDDSTIQAFVERALAQGARSDVAAHLDGCDACRTLLAVMAATGAAPRRYVLISVLGAGGMGVVHAAFDRELDRKVALKLLAADPGERPDVARERLQREARALARLAHPNVIAVHDVGVLDGEVFVAMELVEGPTLRAWLAERGRTTREILGVLRQAGDGLAAAHAAGLVHRDFKPENVLVGSDGRVRVTDFGLARASSQPDGSVDGEAHAPHASLTRTGARAGTLPYMAPEQKAGLALDARADIFSFCVTAHEALAGARPGEPARSKRRIAAWLARVVERGLRARADDRWPSMRQLLDAVDRGSFLSRHGPKLASVLLAASVALGAFAIHRHEQRACADVGAAWGPLWDSPQHDRVQSAFAALGIPDAARAFARVDAALAGYRAQWTEMRTEACEATRVRKEESTSLLDLKLACLDDRRRRVSQLVALFEHPSAEVVEHAVGAAGDLPELEECANARALTAVDPPPTAPAARAALESVSEEYAKADAQASLGQYATAEALAAHALGRARTLGYRPLLARLLFSEGADLERENRSSEAEPLVWEAVAVAAEANDDGVAADAWTWLGYVVGMRRDYDRAEAYYRLSEAYRVRMGGDDRREINWLMMKGYIEGYQHHWEAVEALGRRALEILTRLRKLDADYASGEVYDALGTAHEGEGRLEEALADFQRAVVVREKVLSPTARDIGGALLDEAEVEVLLGRTDDALAHATRAMAIRRVGLRADADGEGVLAAVYRAAGRAQEALEHDTRALADAEAQGGPDDWRASWGLLGQGEDLLALGKPRAAIPLLERARTLRAHDRPPDTEVLFPLARALWDGGGDTARARALAGQAGAIEEADAARYGSYYAKRRDEIRAWLATHAARATGR